MDQSPIRSELGADLSAWRRSIVVERLRDTRARLRLGIPLIDELDVLVDEAALELETAGDIASTVLAHERRTRGELVWIPEESLDEVLELLEEDEDDE